MQEIHASQVKAARVLIGWSQDQLAHMTGLSATTIRKIENGLISPRSRTMGAIRRTIENAGWEFIHPEGIRRRQDEFVIYRGVDSTDLFFDDMMRSLKERGSELYASFDTQELFVRSLGAHNKNNADRLTQIGNLTHVKCLMAEANGEPILLKNFQFRTVTRLFQSPSPFLVHGNDVTFALPEGRDSFCYLSYRNTQLTQNFHAKFCEVWEAGNPLMHTAQDKKRRFS